MSSRKQPESQPFTIALALGGGGVRGMAHINVLEALDELGIKPAAIAGSSIGALVGAAYASGMTGREIRDHVNAVIGNRVEIMQRLWKLRPSTVREAITGGVRLGQFNLERLLRAFLPEVIPEQFAGLEIPLEVTATDYYGQRGVLIGDGAIFPALAASAALPAVFMPVRMEGRVMIDGGIFNPVPYEHLIGRADIVIGVDVVGGPEGDGDEIPTLVDSLFGASQLTMQSLLAAKMQANPPDVMLKPDVARFRVMDFLRAGEVLDATAGIKDELKRLLDAEFAFRLKNGAR